LSFCPFSFGHCVTCPSVLFFGQYVTCPSVLYWTEGQATKWPKEKDRRTNNPMAKEKGQKDKQHNAQQKRTEGQATQWPQEKGHKDKLHNGQKHCVACPSVIFFGHFVAFPSVLSS
jgi:hypothetical protein